MGQKSIGKNYIYNLIYQILTLITPLLTTPYLSRTLGADGIGTYSYVESISSYFVLFATLGLTTFGQREISYVQDDRKRRSVIFWETCCIQTISSLICILCYVVFSVFQSNSIMYLVLVFNLLGVIVNISWFFQGLEEFGKIVFRNILFKTLNIAFVFTFIRDKDDVIIYLFGAGFFGFVNNFSYWIRIGKYVDRPNLKELHPSRHIKTVISLFIPTIAIQIYTVLDKTMIGLITKDAFENGYYEQASKMSKMALSVVTALGTVMVPRIGYYYSKGEKDNVKLYMLKAYRFVWFLGIPLCFGLIAVSSNFVPWFFGDGFEKVETLLSVLSFLILAIGINNVTGVQYLIPTMRQNTFTFTVIIGAVSNFILNYILIMKYQSVGAAIASVAAETIIAVVQLFIVRKELSIRAIVKSSLHYLASGLVMLAVLFYIRRFFSSSIVNSFLLVAIGAAVYFALLFIMRDDFLITYTKKIIGKILKKR